jgi:acetylglutamate kinase
MSPRAHRRSAIRRRTRGVRGANSAIVLKLGGELLESPQRTEAIGAAIAALGRDNPLVVVHGGGRDIDAALARAGIAKRQVDGLRFTDEATLDVVVSVLAGLVNTRLVAAVTAAGGDGIGLTGADGAIGLVQKAEPHAATDGSRVDLGRVGTPVWGQPLHLLSDLYLRGYVPIIATIGVSQSGQLYNVNADTFAAHIASALAAQRLVIAGGTAGVLDEYGKSIRTLDLAAVDRLVRAGTATAGMIAKLSACRDAVAHGVREVFIANGHDLAGLTQLVRHGSRASVAGFTQVRQRHSAQRRGSKRSVGMRTQSRTRASAPTSWSSSNTNLAAETRRAAWDEGVRASEPLRERRRPTDQIAASGAGAGLRVPASEPPRGGRRPTDQIAASGAGLRVPASEPLRGAGAPRTKSRRAARS